MGTVSLTNTSVSAEHGVPTSVDFNGCDPAHMVASFNSGDVAVYDLETSQQALLLKGQGDSSKSDGSRMFWFCWSFSDATSCSLKGQCVKP